MRVVLLVLSLMIPSAFAQETNPLKVMNWSIWHGGREDGKEIGPQRVIEVIKESLLGICFWRKVREERIWAEYIGEKGGVVSLRPSYK